MVPANGAIGERHSTLSTGSEHLQPHRVLQNNSRVPRAGYQIRGPSPRRTKHPDASRRAIPAVGRRRGGQMSRPPSMVQALPPDIELRRRVESVDGIERASSPVPYPKMITAVSTREV